MSNDEETVNMIKFLIIGDKKVGKTSIINRFVYDKFEQGYDATNIINDQKYNVSNKPNLIIKIVDTAGDKQFLNSIINELDKTRFVLIVFDITNKDSFDSVNVWIDKCNLKNQDNLSLILVGNKLDLEQEQRRKVTKQEAKLFAEKNNMEYYETSALTKVNIHNIFNHCSDIYFQNCKNDFEHYSTSTTKLKIHNDSEIKLNINSDKKDLEEKKGRCFCSLF